MESGHKMSNSSSTDSKGGKETSKGIKSIEPPLLSTSRSKKPMLQTDRIGSSKYKRNPKAEIIRKESNERKNDQLSKGMRSVKTAMNRGGSNGQHDAVKVNSQPFSEKLTNTVTSQQEVERERTDNKKKTVRTFDARNINRNKPRNKYLAKPTQGHPRKDNYVRQGDEQQDKAHQRMSLSQQLHASEKTQGHTTDAQGHTNKLEYEDNRNSHDPGHRSHKPINNHEHEDERQVHGQGDHHVHDRGSDQHFLQHGHHGHRSLEHETHPEGHHRHHKVQNQGHVHDGHGIHHHVPHQDKHQQGQQTKHLVNDHHHSHHGHETYRDHLHPHGHDKHTQGHCNKTNVHHHHGHHHVPHHQHHDKSHHEGSRHHWYDQHHRYHHGHSQHDHDKHHHGHHHEPGHHSHGAGKQDIHHHGYAHNRHGKHCLHPHSESSRHPSKLGDFSRKTVSGKHNRFHSDCCSLCSLDANIAFENTYKTDPESQFKSHEIRPIIKRVIEVNLKDRKYDPVAMQKEARAISDDIKIEIKAMQIARYKLVCLVFIGQETSQSIQIASRSLLEKQFDNFASETVLFDDFFATGMVFATYYE